MVGKARRSSATEAVRRPIGPLLQIRFVLVLSALIITGCTASRTSTFDLWLDRAA